MRSTGFGFAVLGTGTLLLAISCTPERRPAGATDGANGSAARALAIRSRFGVAPSEVTSFERSGRGRLRPILAPAVSGRARTTASVELPAHANEPVRVVDDGSRLAIDVVLRGAGASAVVTSDGMAFYPSAVDGASDVLHRVSAEGTEDFIAFDERPVAEVVRYDVDVARVSGLRLVANTLEFLDEGGAPRLRVAPPYVIDAAGARHAANLDVGGCTYDTNPAAPWGRSITRPGAARCTVSVDWSGHDLAYPVLVDPAWTATGSMTTPRKNHSATLLANGRVLVIGGVGMGAAFRISAELFDPAGAGSFAATGSLMKLQPDHVALRLDSGNVLVAGGQLPSSGPGTTLIEAELYDPTTGTFAFTGSMTVPREKHTMTKLASGKVLVAGGEDSGEAAIGNTAEIYNPAAGTFAATGALQVSRSYHAAALLLSGKVLLIGGTGTDDGKTSEVYDPALGTFTTGPSMTVAREQAAIALLPSGKVLVAGGYDDDGLLATADLYDPAGAGSIKATGMMAASRGVPSAVTLASGRILIAGGSFFQSTSQVDIYDDAAGAFSPGDPLLLGLAGQTVTRLASGAVLVAGGASGSAFQSAAEVLAPILGEPCTEATSCGSGICTDGVCCATACAGQCEACDVAGSRGTCVSVSGAPRGKRAACTGSGSTCGGTCTTKDRNACTYAAATASCASSCASAMETSGLCDGKGTCAGIHTDKCRGNLVCQDAAKCLTSCARTTDCLAGFTCTSGQCVPEVGGSCIDDHTSVSSDGKTTTDCGPYLCATKTGTCLEVCQSVDDCRAPNTCDPSSACAPPAKDEGSAGCAVAIRGGNELDASALSLLALASMMLVHRRRARARHAAAER